MAVLIERNKTKVDTKKTEKVGYKDELGSPGKYVINLGSNWTLALIDSHNAFGRPPYHIG